MKKIKTIFFGSGSFAVPILEALAAAEFIDLVAVVSQPDKPVGRKKILTPVPVVKYARESLSIEIFQPKLYRKAEKEILESIEPELIIVADYGQILPIFTIGYPRYKCLNVHASILPKYRGAVPMPMAILNNDKITGVSIPIMTEGLDDGPVVADLKYEMSGGETTESLTSILASKGAKLLIGAIPEWVSGKIEPIDQDESLVSFAPKEALTKDQAFIDVDSELNFIERATRAFYPWPIVWTTVSYNEKKLRLKLFEIEVVNNSDQDFRPGEIVVENGSLYLSLNKGIVSLKRLQLEGKKIGDANDYLYLDGAKLIQ